MGLLELRDELDTARQFVACLWLACQSSSVAIPERAALCAVADAARAKLDEIGAAIDGLIRGCPDSA